MRLLRRIWTRQCNNGSIQQWWRWKSLHLSWCLWCKSPVLCFQSWTTELLPTKFRAQPQYFAYFLYIAFLLSPKRTHFRWDLSLMPGLKQAHWGICTLYYFLSMLAWPRQKLESSYMLLHFCFGGDTSFLLCNNKTLWLSHQARGWIEYLTPKTWEFQVVSWWQIFHSYWAISCLNAKKIP